MDQTLSGTKPWLVVFMLLYLLFGTSALAADYFDAYGLTPGSASLDLGGQPLGYPSGVISAVMQRDRILRADLAALGHPLKTHAFKRGADMVELLVTQKLDAGLLGDMPTLLATSERGVVVVGLVKQTSTAIVAKGVTQVQGLAGKRIGYIPLSSAHSTLLQGLAAAGLTETDVTLIPLGVELMPDALAQEKIDAFVAWEPATSLALGRSTLNRVVFRGLSTDYFVLNRALVERSPEAADRVVAGFVRAIEWLRLSQKNLQAAARWVLADAQALTGNAPAANAAQITAITRRDILGIPSAPVILRSPGAPHPLKSEYDFLQKLGKLPPGNQWEGVVAAFSYDGLTRVLAGSRKHRVRVFDYDS
jgi:NitT/TauT family transport system substrate-binding protein